MEVDWVAFYQMADEILEQMVHGKSLMSDEESRDTGLLSSKYFEFFEFVIFLFICFYHFAGKTWVILIYRFTSFERGRKFP